ncbi:MAG: hypothetical protein J5I98_16865 [Phaeodactylibacter sp.]|nr:hypothetical protein [Phaeodactylibacter sp.]
MKKCLFNFWLLVLASWLNAQSVPAIYTGTDSPCSGTELMDAYIACSEGDGNACSLYEEKLQWILDSCAFDGDSHESSKEAITKAKPNKSENPKNSSTEDSKKVANEIWVLPGPDPVLNCNVWAITRDFKSYGRVELVQEKCQFKPGSMKSLSISLPPIQAAEERVIVIRKEGWENIRKANEAWGWENSEEDPTSDNDFLILLKGPQYIWIAYQGGNKKLDGIGPGLWDSSYGLIEKLAIMTYLDPTITVVIPPIPENSKAVVRGRYKGKNYILGLEQNGFSYDPIQLDSEENKSRLTELLSSGASLREPLRAMIEEWRRGGDVKYIKASVVFRGRSHKYASPKEAWNDTEGGVSADANFLIYNYTDTTYEIYGPNAGQIEKVEWYGEVSENGYKNPYLALLAVADPYCKVLKMEGNKIALLTGNPDDLYILEIPENNDKPPSRGILTGEPGKQMEDWEKEAYLNFMKKNRKIHPNLEIYF